MGGGVAGGAVSPASGVAGGAAGPVSSTDAISVASFNMGIALSQLEKLEVDHVSTYTDIHTPVYTWIDTDLPSPYIHAYICVYIHIISINTFLSIYIYTYT